MRSEMMFRSTSLNVFQDTGCSYVFHSQAQAIARENGKGCNTCPSTDRCKPNTEIRFICFRQKHHSSLRRIVWRCFRGEHPLR